MSREASHSYNIAPDTVADVTLKIGDASSPKQIVVLAVFIVPGATKFSFIKIVADVVQPSTVSAITTTSALSVIKIEGVKLCKLKLKRFVSVVKLIEAIKVAHNLGLKIVLGDGLGTEINCWMEARIANELIDNAGEYNGFIKIKPEARILLNPLKFDNGYLIIPKNWNLEIDSDKLEKYSIVSETIYK